MSWNERLKDELPREQIPRFLMDLQAFVESLRNGQTSQVSQLLLDNADLALAYIDGPKKQIAAKLLAP
jgi:hypothetical protein